MVDDNTMTSDEGSGEGPTDRTMRPTGFSEYVGQDRIREKAAVAVQAAQMRGDVLDHVLIEGPAGLGKTTLAGILAAEMFANLYTAHAATLKDAEDLLGTLLKFQKGDMFFVDEVHALGRNVQEYLYTAMEDYHIDVLHGKGTGAGFVRYDLPPFTLIGATTRGGELDAPFRARFGLQLALTWYSPESLAELLHAAARKMGLFHRLDALDVIAARSRGTPRVALRLLRRCRDYAEVMADGILTVEAAEAGLTAEGVDQRGLTDLDRELLRTLIVNFNGGPAGLAAVASSIGRNERELEEVCEPYLLQAGMLLRTPRGRKATDAAREHLGL